MKRVIATVPVLGLAYEKSKISEQLECNVRQICNHLIKLYRYPDVDSNHHWQQEIYSMLHEVARLKSTKKYPSEKFIMKYTYDMNKDDVSRWIELISEEYDESYPNHVTDMSEIQNKIEMYFKWLSQQLSKNGEVFPKAVYRELESLGFGG